MARSRCAAVYAWNTHLDHHRMKSPHWMDGWTDESKTGWPGQRCEDGKMINEISRLRLRLHHHFRGGKAKKKSRKNLNNI